MCFSQEKLPWSFPCTASKTSVIRLSTNHTRPCSPNRSRRSYYDPLSIAHGQYVQRIDRISVETLIVNAVSLNPAYVLIHVPQLSARTWTTHNTIMRPSLETYNLHFNIWSHSMNICNFFQLILFLIHALYTYSINLIEYRLRICGCYRQIYIVSERDFGLRKFLPF